MKCLLCNKELDNPKAKFCSDAHKMAYHRGKKKIVTEKIVVEANIPKNDTVCFGNCDTVMDTVMPEKNNKMWVPSAEDRRRLEEKNKRLAELGLKPVMFGVDEKPPEFIPSGIKEIDELVGGFPKGRITEIYGMQGVGKTQLVMFMLRKVPVKTLYIDTEAAVWTPIPNIEVVHENVLENVSGFVEDALLDGSYDLIVVDSIASAIPLKELEGESGDTFVGVKARFMSQWMRRIPAFIYGKKTVVLFINQQREKITSWGPVKFTPGGWALPFAASLRLELKCKKADKKEHYQLVEVTVMKSRFARPLAQTEFKLEY